MLFLEKLYYASFVDQIILRTIMPYESLYFKNLMRNAWPIYQSSPVNFWNISLGLMIVPNFEKHQML